MAAVLHHHLNLLTCFLALAVAKDNYTDENGTEYIWDPSEEDWYFVDSSGER